MIKISCKKCGHINVLKDEERYYGKSINFKCKNSACQSEISYFVQNKNVSNNVTQLITKNTVSEKKIARLKLENIKNGAIKFYVLSEGIQTIGRKSKDIKSSIQLDIDDYKISRNHCTIKGFPGNATSDLIFAIYDNGSKNGVEINGKKIGNNDQIILQPGDQIKLGSTVLLFEYFQ